jgi:FkbM family methyltransferase
MKIFLDVGAHEGETLEAVLDPKYQFQRIVAFEPVASCCEVLRRRFSDPRVEIQPFGISDRTGERILFGAGTLGGSVFPDTAEASGGRSERCRFVRATDWLHENVRPEDEVIMKLNCEGSECDILDDLLESGEWARITSLMVDFDVRKIPSQRHRERDLRERLVATDANRFRFCEDVMIGRTPFARVQNWLREIGADRCPYGAKVRQMVYLARSPWRVGRRVAGMRIGRLRRRFSGAAWP